MSDTLKDRFRRLVKSYQKRSIQFMISLSFTVVAMAGMVFLGMALYLRFTSATETMLKEENRRVIDQVNINLDVYLRNMMRVSDSMYYRVIKNSDLAVEPIDKSMNLLYETNRDLLISIVVLDENGELVGVSPVSKLKKTARPEEQEWYMRAMNKIENLHFSSPMSRTCLKIPIFVTAG